MKNQTINLGILLDSAEIPAWQYYLIEQLLASTYVSVSIVVVNEINDSVHSQIGSGTFYRAFQRHENRRKDFHPDACEPRFANDLFVSDKTGQRPPFFTCDSSRDREKLRCKLADVQLDVILALGCLQSIVALSDLARFGVWYFWHDYGQTHKVDGSSVGFWEVLSSRPYVRSALVIRKPDLAEAVSAYESYSAVHFRSPLQTRNEHLWKILFFVPRALRRLYEIGPDDFFTDIGKWPNSDPIQKSANQWPLTNSRLLIPMVRYAIRRLWLKLEWKLFHERWALMYSTSGCTRDLTTFKLISPPTGRFWADPSALQRNGTNFIFFEDASIRTGRGHISVMRMDRDGVYGAPTNILDKPYHLSYPFVFEWDGVTYMVPESAENHTIELYRCIEFPYRWEFVHNLMENLAAYDATFVEYDQLWWMFVNIQQHSGASNWDELCLFYSDSPISQDWHPHPRNPIVSDVRSARPAGRIYEQNGQLHRPSQNCSFRYGYALNINRILELTKTTYREQLVRTIEPNWSSSIRAVHTLNCVDGLTLIDVMHRSRKKPLVR